MKFVMLKSLGLAMLAGLATASVVHADPAADGKTLFTRKCSACHQASGRGIPGAFPALAGDKFVQTKDATPIITTVLKGRAGMPSFMGNTDDETLASILTYVRSSWGNAAAPVKKEDVSKVRAKLGNVAPPKINN
jgi:cytochrome c6